MNLFFISFNLVKRFRILFVYFKMIDDKKLTNARFLSLVSLLIHRLHCITQALFIRTFTSQSTIIELIFDYIIASLSNRYNFFVELCLECKRNFNSILKKINAKSNY